jgi:Tfp pilus assembly protein PilF
VRSHQFGDAQYQALQLAQASPRDVVPHLLLLENYTNSRHLDLAKTLVEDILNRFPKSHLAHQECSRYFTHIGDTATAISLLNKAISLKPANDFCHFLLGHTFSLMGKKEQAEEAELGSSHGFQS